MKNEWSQADLSVLVRMWNEGVPSSQIGAAVGRNKDAITGKARRMGLAKRADPTSQIANFADRLAEHGNVERAGKEIKVSFSKAKELFDRLCRELGAQAV